MDTGKRNKIIYRIFFMAMIIMCSKMSVSAQICVVPMQKDLRPDTTTIYSFANKKLHVSAFPNSKPLSYCSFKIKTFKMIWSPFPFNNANDTAFIRKTIYTDRNTRVVDTIAMNIFGDPFNGFVVEQKGRYTLALFPVNSGRQNVFFAVPKRKKRLNECIAYIRTNFSNQ